MPAKILDGAAEVYWKPKAQMLVLRKVGLDTSSEAWKKNTVPRINEFVDRMEGHSFPTRCKGKDWDPFTACLRREGRKEWRK